MGHSEMSKTMTLSTGKLPLQIVLTVNNQMNDKH